MKERREVRNQHELDKAIRDGCRAIVIGSASVEAWGSALVVARDSASVVAWGSASVMARDSASVVAWGSASVVAWDSASVVAWGSASVEARDSASVVARDSASVEAWGSASVEAWGSALVVAWGSASVEAWDSASVVAWGSASVEARGTRPLVRIESPNAKVGGGTQITRPGTVGTWCEQYGVPVRDGVMTLYKAVDGQYQSRHGGDYTPGTTPVAEDWDGGEAECGGGLHFSPHPKLAEAFGPPNPTYIACPVAVDDAAVHQWGHMSEKIKARGCCGPVWECDREGNPVESKSPASE